MTTQPVGPRASASSPHWYPAARTCSRVYLLAGLRAGLIAVALLVVLAIIVF